MEARALFREAQDGGKGWKGTQFKTVESTRNSGSRQSERERQRE